MGYIVCYNSLLNYKLNSYTMYCTLKLKTCNYILNLLYLKILPKSLYKAMAYDIIMEVIKNNYDTKLCYKKGGANGKENNCEI